MDNELFMNVSEMTSLSSSSPAMLNWASSMETHPLEQSVITRNVPRDCFFWEKSTEQSVIGSAPTSHVSPPSVSNFSGGGGGAIGNLGNIGDIYGAPASIIGNSSGSLYAAPTMSSSPPLDAFSGDSRFAERAARFSCFNGRGTTNGPVAETASINGELTRVSSTSALKPPTGESSGESSRKRKGKSKENSHSSTVTPSHNLPKVR